MSDPSFATLNFARNLPQTTLTDLAGGAVDLYQQKEAARIQKNNEITYDQLLQSYMQDPSEENLVALYGAAEPLGRTDQTRATVGEVQQIRADRAAAELRAEQEATYNAALQTYMADKSRENWMALKEAASPLGRFDEMMASTDKLTDLEVQQDVEELAGILAPLRSGAPDAAIAAAEKYAEAYTNAGDDEAAQGFMDIVERIKNGEGEEVDNYLSVMAGTLGERGLNLIDNVLQLRGAERADFLAEADLLRIANQLDFATEEDRARAMEAADGLPYGLGEALVELSSVRSKLTDPDKGGMTLEDLLRVEESLRKEYDDYVEPYETVIDQFDVMYALTDNMTDPNGMSDQALLTLYNKVLDPNSVVREAEAMRTQEAQGWFDRVANLPQKIQAGTTFTDATRQALIEAAVGINDIAQREIDRQRDRIERTTSELDKLSLDFDLEGITSDRVFPDKRDTETRRRDRQTLIEETAQEYDDPLRARVLMEGLTEAEIRTTFADGVAMIEAANAPPPPLTGNRSNDFRAFVANRAGVSVESLAEYSDEYLREKNPGAAAAFDEANPIGEGREM
jgi:hypothetical protein